MSMNNVLTTNTQAEANYQLAAIDIMDLFDSLGFTTDKQIDPSIVRQEIVLAIRNRIEGNTFYAEVCGESTENIPTDEELRTLFEDESCGGCEDCKFDKHCECDCDHCGGLTSYPPTEE